MTERKTGRSGSEAATPGLDQGAIERRARDIYVAHGSQPGRDVENWLQAERELLEELGRGKARRGRR
jgi:hypothetical protein